MWSLQIYNLNVSYLVLYFSSLPTPVWIQPLSWVFKRMFIHLDYVKGLPRWHSGKESTCQCRRCKGLIPGLGRSPGGGNGNHSSILAWEISWTEKPGGLQSMGSQRHDWTHTHTHTQEVHSSRIEKKLKRWVYIKHSYFQRRQHSIFLVVPIPETVITVLGPQIFHNSHKIAFPLLFFLKAPHSSPWSLVIQIRVFDFCSLNINKKPHVASAGVPYISYLDSGMPNFILLAIYLLFYYVSLLNSIFLCSECGVALNEREQALMCRLNGCCTRRASCSEGAWTHGTSVKALAHIPKDHFGCRVNENFKIFKSSPRKNLQRKE